MKWYENGIYTDRKYHFRKGNNTQYLWMKWNMVCIST